MKLSIKQKTGLHGKMLTKMLKNSYFSNLTSADVVTLLVIRY